MIIPVRVPATARPIRATEAPKTVGFDHPMATSCCPVCGDHLGGSEVHLIVVGCEGWEPGKAWQTGAAVAVHVECCMPGDVVG